MTAHIVAFCDANPPTQTLGTASGLSGIYHAAGAGETTWAGFAEESIRQTKTAHPSVQLAAVTPIPTREYPTPARRPANSRLNCNNLKRVFGYTMMPWRDSLSQVLAELA